MDMNLVVLGGRLAAPPDLRTFESGSKLVRSLVTVRSESPRRRVDVVPVTLWDPAKDHEVIEAAVGSRLWVVGTVQRRFWSVGDERRSKLELVAHHIELRPSEVECATGNGSRIAAEQRR